MRIPRILSVAVITTGLAAPAVAATVFFNDRTAFDAVIVNQFDPTGLSTVTTQAEVEALTTDGNASYNVSTSGGTLPPIVLKGQNGVGEISVIPEKATGFNYNHGFYASATTTSTTILGAPYAIGNPVDENHSYTFADGILAFGLEVDNSADNSICVVGCFPGTFQIEAFDLNGLSLGSISETDPNGATSFLGFSSDVLVGRLEVRELNGFFDNEYFGNYVSGSLAGSQPDVSPVPLPAPLALLAAGLVGLGALRGARRR